MKRFMDENFLLESKVAEELYHGYAEDLPIIDYHCHLSPADIANDRKFKNITAIWLDGDHYKWRAMRTNGVGEKFITGNSDDYERFAKWAETVPYTLRNPLYHWTHLELKRYFGIDKLLNPATAKEIYDETSRLLQTDDFSVQNLLKKMRVEVVCTTDDPVDSLEYHDIHAMNATNIKMLPTWRPDRAMQVGNTIAFNQYIDRLQSVCDIGITRFDDLLEALKIRHDFFHERGCRVSDHGIDRFYTDDFTHGAMSSCFNRVRSGQSLNAEEASMFKSGMLYYLALMDAAKGWVQQYHAGAIRNNNTGMMLKVGPDTGFDSIGDTPNALNISAFLDRLNSEGKLTKTILYNLNPSDNEVFATMTGNFQDGSFPGKIQWGAAWWFMDQKSGIERHLDALSSLGLLSRFIGMLTDSRSFLSFPRHEYFRRILCNTIGRDIEKGEIPYDMELAGNMVRNICYYNAKNYFSF